MWIKARRGWEVPESDATPEAVYWKRRDVLRAGLASGLIAAAGPSILDSPARAEEALPGADLYPVPRNPAFDEGVLTPQEPVTTYNNFYEFGSHKNIWRAAQKLRVHPWTVTFDGLVEREQTIDVDELLRRMPLEERVYRHRCVEAWAMVVPWSGFPLKALIDMARPLGSARYVQMETFLDPDQAPGQRQFWYPWPYTEGLTLDEANNELAFIATGLYGKPIPKQNGAPLRLATPWKYGFKSIKSIVRFTFTEERPKTFWETVGSGEYGFWANVNPDVPHPRWSQAEERMLGTDEMRPTRIFNGYGEWVAGLYDGLEGETLFR